MEYFCKKNNNTADIYVTKEEKSRRKQTGSKFPYWGVLNYVNSLCIRVSPILYIANPNPNPTGPSTTQYGNYSSNRSDSNMISSKAVDKHSFKVSPLTPHCLVRSHNGTKKIQTFATLNILFFSIFLIFTLLVEGIEGAAIYFFLLCILHYILGQQFSKFKFPLHLPKFG